MEVEGERQQSLAARLHTLMCKLHGVAEWLRSPCETLPLNPDEVALGQSELVSEMAEEARELRDRVEKLEHADS